jgi:hypothetical protein
LNYTEIIDSPSLLPIFFKYIKGAGQEESVPPFLFSISKLPYPYTTVMKTMIYLIMYIVVTRLINVVPVYIYRPYKSSLLEALEDSYLSTPSSHTSPPIISQIAGLGHGGWFMVLVGALSWEHPVN